MKTHPGRHKTIAESKITCLQIREKKTRVIENLHKFTKIVEVDRLLKKLPEDIKKTKKTLEESKKGFSELQPQVETLSGYNEKLKVDVDKIDMELRPLNSEVAGLKTCLEKLEEKKSTVEDLQKNVAQLELERNSIDSRIKGIGPEAQSLKEETSSLQSRLTVQTEELSRLEPEKQQLTMDLERLSGTIKSLGELEGQKKDLINLVANNSETTEKISALRTTLDQNTQLNEKITSDTNNIKEVVDAIGKTVDEQKNKVKTLNEVVIPKEEVDKIQTRINDYTKEISGFKERTEKVTKELEEHLKNKGGIIEEVEKSKAELESISNKYAKQKEKIELYEKNPEQLERLKNIIVEKEKNIGEYIKRRETVQEKLKHLHNAEDIIKTELIGYQEAMEHIGRLLEIGD